ncbi:hypothetical protein A2774_05540 [Candidatus Roizmanbacteria bacterium RIFCSPHIGHO2_01_FULL_39_12c]|uniref:RNA signal recognition particle n=1 Tax=Candidatus Roizmanbacteria bacterium RIFCSPHIGHO2_01_FULL_39_12c TaxID=1802031 RepID=A0A1F7GF03_9BACT|nr:MAG: hypothetical protein A2774_05540 [Candidatus Roizmanbacteria bacterium RIFCSPHIGHO2_01_FULL_39_12c]
MAKYLDGFVLSIPKKNTVKYKKMAEDARDVWKKFGALDYKECKIDDVKPGKFVNFTFPKMAKTKKDEETWFSFIVYNNKKHRDKVNKKVMAYYEKKYGKDMSKKMPFDMKRFAYGGFEVMIEV